MTKPDSLDELLSELANQWTDEFLVVFADTATDYSQDFVDKLKVKFLSTFIEAIVLDTLAQNQPGKSKKKRFEITHKNFVALKNGVMNAVAEGFGNAMSTFTGNQVDYICQVDVMGEPINKELC